MHDILVHSIIGVFALFSGLTVLITVGKAWRELVGAYRRVRRRELEPALLRYAHGDGDSVLPALGGRLRRRDRQVVESVVLDHIQRVRGIERDRLAHALEELGYVDRHLAALGSARWWRRAQACEKLGLACSKRAVDRLVAAMDDDVPEVRIRAAKALGAVGGRASARPLIDALCEPNRWSTLRIAEVLSGMGREVGEELIEIFPRLNHPARLAALDILARIRPLEAVTWLRLLLSDDDPDIRARAARALGCIGEPGSGSRLAGALSDRAWPVRAMAAKALGRLRHRNAIPALCAALRDAEWWVRVNAAEALRLMGPEGISALDRMLDDPDNYARHQAVLMLQQAGELDRRVDELAAADPTRRSRAIEWVRRLVRVGQTGRLTELAFAHRDPGVRSRLAEMLRIDTGTGEPEAVA